MNLGLQLSRQFSNRWIFFLQPFPHCGRILFVRSSHRLLRGQTPGSQIASHRPHRNLQIEFSRQQILHRFPRPQCKGQVQLVRTTTDNVAHRRGCLMWCQSRNWRPSSTSRFQRSTSYAFHQPPPAAHRTSSYPENPSRLGLRKTFLNGLNGSPAKVFLSFRRQRASILFSHARHATTLPSECHLYYAPISRYAQKSGIDVLAFAAEKLSDKVIAANDATAAKKYQEFLNAVRANVTYEEFSNPDQLAAAVSTGI